MGPTGTSSAPREPAVLPSAFWGPRVKPCTASGCLQRTLGELEGAGKMGTNMEQMFHNLNLRTVILQGESYLKKRKKKKKLTGFSGIVTSVYT